jgi:hypothetical protein
VDAPSAYVRPCVGLQKVKLTLRVLLLFAQWTCMYACLWCALTMARVLQWGESEPITSTNPACGVIWARYTPQLYNNAYMSTHGDTSLKPRTSPVTTRVEPRELASKATQCDPLTPQIINRFKLAAWSLAREAALHVNSTMQSHPDGVYDEQNHRDRNSVHVANPRTRYKHTSAMAFGPTQ